MKTILLSFFAFMHISIAYGQKVVALNSSGNTQMFQGLNPFVDAYAAANNGDTIYLPGGTVNAPTSFNKSVFIFGAGYHPDTSAATIHTTISGNINLQSATSGAFFQGIEFFGSISMPNNTEISGVSFSRCKFNNTIAFPGSTGAQLFSFTECVFLGGLNLSNMISSSINNSLIEGRVDNSKNNNLSNNIFLRNGGYTNPVLIGCHNNFISNNIFLSSSEYITSNYLSSWVSSSNTYRNNIFVTTGPIYGSDPTAIDSYVGVDPSTLLVNQSGHTFSFEHDYALQNPSTYPAYNTNEVGIFGGPMPWKIGGIPLNPHIQSQTIGGQTDTAGQLQIEITIESQNH
jgi:hypothetical protein